jgi:hemoglobin-like flavoprotein
MTLDQVELVRSSWPIQAERADRFASVFYEHLFSIDASAARLFAAADIDAQRKKLAQSLTAFVRALDAPDQLLPAIGALAKRHVGYGVELRHFDSVGDALLWALADTLGPRFTPELREAWAEAYALIASVMKRAIERSAVAAS